MAAHLTTTTPRSPQSARRVGRRPLSRHAARMPRLPQGPYRPHDRPDDRQVATAAVAAVSAPARRPNIALAGLELLVGYEWLVSGVDKLLYGNFPGTLAGLLTGTLSGGRLPDFFATLLRGLVMPHAPAFGYLVEWGEVLAGLGLLAAGLLELVGPSVRRRLTGPGRVTFERGARLLDGLTPVAATGAGLLGLSFFL